MIETKYNVGENVYLGWKVTSITMTERAIVYKLVFLHDGDPLNFMELTEELLDDVECVPIKDYEDEINDLKDEITRLKEMYQLEHMKVLKAKFKAPTGITGDSHHPQENIYSDDWRRP